MDAAHRAATNPDPSTPTKHRVKGAVSRNRLRRYQARKAHDLNLASFTDDGLWIIAPFLQNPTIGIEVQRQTSGTRYKGRTGAVQAPSPVDFDQLGGDGGIAITEFASISAGEEHTCGVGIDGSVACWGEDWSGETSPPDGGFASVSVGMVRRIFLPIVGLDCLYSCHLKPTDAGGCAMAKKKSTLRPG